MSSYSDFIDAYLPDSYWRLGETVGTSAVDRGADSRNGTYGNTPLLNQTSLTKGDDGSDPSVNFRAAQSEYVNIGDFHDTSYSNAVSWNFWIQTTSSSYAGLISKKQNTSDQKGYSIFITAGGYIEWWIGANFTTNAVRITTTESPVNDGLPHNVCCTNDAIGSDASMLHIYIDGVEVAFSVQMNFVSVASSHTQTLSFAADHKNTKDYFNGTLDEIFFVRELLSDQDVLDIYAEGAGLVFVEVVDSAATTDSAFGTFIFEAASTDSMELAEVLITEVAKVCIESILFDSSPGQLAYIIDAFNADTTIIEKLNLVAEVIEAVNAADTVASAAAKGILEGLAMNEAWAGNMVLQGNIMDTLSLAEVIRLTWDQLVADSVSLTDPASVYARKSAVLAEALVTAGIVSNIYKAVSIVTEALILQDVAARFFELAATESVNITDADVALYRAVAENIEAAVMADALAGTRRLSLLISDELVGTDTTNISQRLQAALTDDAVFGGTIVLPDGVFSAIVLNTETLGISEYTNYPFNSFGKLGADYLGASDTDIFKLTGDDDAGTDIDAVIRTSMTNFGTNVFKRVPRAYLGYTSDGGMIMKTISTSGGVKTERWYELTPRTADAHVAARIQLGRGIKATYWQFELINKLGADFDIDSLQLYPMILKRRV